MMLFFYRALILAGAVFWVTNSYGAATQCKGPGVDLGGWQSWGLGRGCKDSRLLLDGAFLTMKGSLKQAFDEASGYRLFLRGAPLSFGAFNGVSFLYFYPVVGEVKYLLISGVSSDIDCGEVYVFIDFSKKSKYLDYYVLDDGCFDGDALRRLSVFSGGVSIHFDASTSLTTERLQPGVEYKYDGVDLYALIKKNGRFVRLRKEKIRAN